MPEYHIRLYGGFLMKETYTDSEKLLYAMIARFKDQPDGCFMTNESLGKSLGWKESKVRRVLSILKKHGLVSIWTDGHSRKIWTKGNPPINAQVVDGDLPINEQVTCSNISTNLLKNEHPIILDDKREIKEPTISVQTTQNIARSGTNGFFDQFWSVYPRKQGKGAARRIWDRLKPDQPLLNKMLNTLAWQRNSEQWTKEGGQFIPLPATWLNQNRWEDEPLPKNRPAFNVQKPRPVSFCPKCNTRLNNGVCPTCLQNDKPVQKFGEIMKTRFRAATTPNEKESYIPEAATNVGSAGSATKE